MKRFWAMALAGLLLVSCRTPDKKAPEPVDAAPERTWQMRVAGEVERVNARQGYVIVKCTVLPSAGEEATVYREDEKVGRIRFTGSARPPYMTADILDGRPQRGDRVRE